MALGDKIRSLRESQGVSQKELATKIGVSTGTVAEWEADEAVPDIVALAKLSKALSVPSEDLLSALTKDAPIHKEQPKSAPPIPAKRKNSVLVYLLIAIGVLSILVVGLLVGFSFVSTNDEASTSTETIPFSQDTAAIEKADASVVTVFCYDYEGELAATGSGFIAFDGKTVVTNYHVMTSAYTCKISTNQDISYEAEHILAYSKEQDIAILELIEDTELEPLNLGDSKAIKKGEPVVAIGSPLGIKNTVSTGVLSGRLMEDNMDVLQFTAPISSGSSGGALFDDNGNVIGITYASYVDGQNLNLAIPVELINVLHESKKGMYNVETIFLEENPLDAYLLNNRTIQEVTISDLKANPEQYDNKVIRLTAHVSSLQLGAAEDSIILSMYVSEEKNVSLDYDLDDSRFMYHKYEFADLPCIRCYMQNCNGVYGVVNEGNLVVIFGEFSYIGSGFMNRRAASIRVDYVVAEP